MKIESKETNNNYTKEGQETSNHKNQLISMVMLKEIRGKVMISIGKTPIIIKNHII